MTPHGPLEAVAAVAVKAPLTAKQLALVRARTESFVFRRSYRKHVLMKERKIKCALKKEVARAGESIR